METKVCSKCGISKPFSEFYIQRNWCKSCMHLRNKKYYASRQEEARKLRRKYHLEHKESENKYGREWYANNKERGQTTSLTWYFDNLERAKANHLRHKFGITVDDYNKLLIAQDGKCAICGKSQIEFDVSFCVDHDHITGEIRGLLCGNCNKALGCFGDDLNTIKAACNYIEKRMKTIPVFILANNNSIYKPDKTGKEG